MSTATIDVLQVYRTQGASVAFKALNAYIEKPPGGWGKKAVQDLERWAIAFSGMEVWPLAVLIWIALLLSLKAGGEEEKRAYFFNDLGTAFALILDPRCFQCFFKALRLTKSPGRRMRTLQRYGNSAAIIMREYEKARRYIKAAIFVGERYRLDAKRVGEMKIILQELERHLVGGKGSGEPVPLQRCEAIRRDMEEKRDPALVHMLQNLDVSGFS